MATLTPKPMRYWHGDDTPETQWAEPVTDEQYSGPRSSDR